MTDTAIQSQIATIKSATQKALASKETAIKFLVDAGILKVAVKKDRVYFPYLNSTGSSAI